MHHWAFCGCADDRRRVFSPRIAEEPYVIKSAERSYLGDQLSPETRERYTKAHCLIRPQTLHFLHPYVDPQAHATLEAWRAATQRALCDLTFRGRVLAPHLSSLSSGLKRMGAQGRTWRERLGEQRITILF
jgi:hypothetical protein